MLNQGFGSQLVVQKCCVPPLKVDAKKKSWGFCRGEKNTKHTKHMGLYFFWGDQLQVRLGSSTLAKQTLAT